jgi:hypothetical protein
LIQFIVAGNGRLNCGKELETHSVRAVEVMRITSKALIFISGGDQVGILTGTSPVCRFQKYY